MLRGDKKPRQPMPLGKVTRGIGEISMKAIANGAMVAFMARMLFNEEGNVTLPLINQSVPVWVPFMMSGAAGSVVADTFEKEFLENVPIPVESARVASLIAKSTLASVGTILPIRFLIGMPLTMDTVGRAVALGAGSKFASDWVVDNVILKSQKGFIL